MTKSIWTTVFAAAVSLACASTSNAEDALKGFPLAILCGQQGEVDLAYIGNISSDGTATYVSAIGQRALTITSDGPATSVVQTAPGGECIGKTLEILRSEGRTLEVSD